MIKAIYFALCFAIAFLGLVIAIHINFWIGISIFLLFIFKFWYQLPNLTEENSVKKKM